MFKVISQLFKVSVLICLGLFVFLGAKDVNASGFTITAPEGVVTINGEFTPVPGVSINGTGNVPVSLRVLNGTLRITETTGLTMSTATSASLIEFSGDVAYVNNALATLEYMGNSANEFVLEISLVTAGGVYFEETGSVYRFVQDAGITWNEALIDAALQEFDTGNEIINGYLVIVESQEENDFIASRLEGAPAWLGATDSAVEDTWRWISTPESANDPKSGVHFWTGDGSGAVVPGEYENWNDGEPNDSSNNEDCAQFIVGGVARWNDLPCSSTVVSGYVVEFNGGETQLTDGAEVTLTVVNAPDINSPDADTITDELAFDLDVNAAGQAGSFRLIFEEDDEVVNTLTLADLNVGNHTFTIDHEDVTNIAQVASATSNTLDEAIYDITFEYTLADGSRSVSREVTDVAFDLVIPTVVSFTPSDNSATRNPDNFQINFSEAVQSGGAGSFRIYRASDDGLIYSASFAAVDIQGSGTSTLTFDTGADFIAGNEYYIQFTDGFFIDMRGRQVTGYGDNDTDWNFTFRRSSASVPEPINLDEVEVDVSSVDSGASFACVDGRVEVAISFSYDGTRYYVMNDSDDFSGLPWSNYSGDRVVEEFVYDVDSIPDSVYIKFQNFEGAQAVATVSLNSVSCKEEIVEEEEVVEDEIEELVDYSDLEPVFSDYYGVLWAPDSDLTGPSPWDGSIEKINSVAPGWFIRGRSYDTVYLVTEDMKRRPFMNAQTFLTYADWEDVIWVQDATLQTLPMAPMIVPKAEVVLVKLESKSDVYFVEAGEVPVLRRLAGEGVARELFGEDWADYVLDISPSMFRSYSVGEEIDEVEDLPELDASRMVKRSDLQ